jgi:RNA polymerase sigma-70 factor (ECF subfamily)
VDGEHTDHAVIAAFQSGDEFAFVTLYNRHKEGIYVFCKKVLLDESAAKDVMQETFLRIYENRDRLMKTDAFRSWIYTIARNQCYNYLRRAKRFVALDPGFVDDSVVETNPFGDLEKSDQVAMVNRLLTSLKIEYREVLVLREYQNLTYDEIAQVMRTSVSSVKSRLFKARRKLAQQYSAYARQSNQEQTSGETLELQTDVTHQLIPTSTKLADSDSSETAATSGRAIT